MISPPIPLPLHLFHFHFLREREREREHSVTQEFEGGNKRPEESLVMLAGEMGEKTPAYSFTSPFPHCVFGLPKSSFSHPFVLYIPAQFAKAHLPCITTYLKIRNLEGKFWHIKFYKSKYAHLLTEGWKAFTLDNALKMGDYCAFEHVDKLDMRVQIFRGMKLSTNTLSEGDMPAPLVSCSMRAKMVKLPPNVAGLGRPDSSWVGVKRNMPPIDINHHYAKKSKNLPVYSSDKDLRHGCSAPAAHNAPRVELPHKLARDPLENFEDDDDCYIYTPQCLSVPPRTRTTEIVMPELLGGCSQKGDERWVGNSSESVEEGDHIVSKDVNFSVSKRPSGFQSLGGSDSDQFSQDIITVETELLFVDEKGNIHEKLNADSDTFQNQQLNTHNIRGTSLLNIIREMQSLVKKPNEDVQNSVVYQDGTLMLPCHADIYHRILLRYGRLESSQVVKSMNSVLFAVLSEILTVAQAMERVNVGELVPETLENWDSAVNLGELLKFNVGWLRKSLDHLKALFLRRRQLSIKSLEMKLKNCREAVGNACERLSKFKANVESAEKELKSLIQEENDGTKALVEADDVLKRLELFELKI